MRPMPAVPSALRPRSSGSRWVGPADPRPPPAPPGTQALEAAAADVRRGCGPARPHPRRPGRDRAAPAGPRLRRPFPVGHGGPHRPVAPALPRPAARDRPRRSTGGARALGPTAVDGPAQRRSRLRPGAGARAARRPDGRPRARGRARPGPVGGAAARRRRSPGRARRGRARASRRRSTTRQASAADCEALAAMPSAVRTRVIRLMCLQRGSPAEALGPGPRAPGRRPRHRTGRVRATSRCRAVSPRLARMEG